MNRTGCVILLIILACSHIPAITGESEQGPNKTDTTRASSVPTLKYGRGVNISRADASFLGEYPGDISGMGFSGVGDVNGDGYYDIMVGGQYNDEAGVNAGKAYLVFGKSYGWERSINLSQADASFLGEREGDMAGRHTTGAGDVNRDGFDDILISAPFYDRDPDEMNIGKVYLIYGKRTGWEKNTPLNESDASFIEDDWGSRTGYVGLNVEGVGDVNGDGYDDFVIGIPMNHSCVYRGQAHLFLGNEKGWGKDTNLSEADVTIEGIWEGPYLNNILGMAAEDIGDINGDGIDDLFISMRHAFEGKGGGAIFFGKRSGWSNFIDISDCDASIIGTSNETDEWTLAGEFISGAGDVNGDGINDILISSRFEEGESNRVSLFYGRKKGWARNMSLDEADSEFLSERWDVKIRCSEAGDVNGDGYDDIVLSAPFLDSGGPRYGKVYLYTGQEDPWGKGMNISSCDATFIGEVEWDCAGYWIDGVGDVNGDGYDDIFIGAPWNWENGYVPKSGGEETRDRIGAGKVYLIFPFENHKPTQISSVSVYSDTLYSNEAFYVKQDSTLFMQLVGSDINSTCVDIAYVKVSSNASDPAGIRIPLIETGPNTGIFRNSLQLLDCSDEKRRTLHSGNWENITVMSSVDPSVRAFVWTTDAVNILKVEHDQSIIEDKEFELEFSAYGYNQVSIWDLQTDAGWLNWDPTGHNLTGTPDNGDVGTYFIKLNITDSLGSYDEINCTLEVTNRDPIISFTPSTSAYEDNEYSVDLDADDEGQGDTTWTLVKGPTWLSLDAASGLLNGTPSNDDVGTHQIEVLFDDGNGGNDTLDYVLTVYDENDVPQLIVDPLTEVYQDGTYMLLLEALDVDIISDTISWELNTNADWLSLEQVDKKLIGTPTKYDIGEFWVNITISDGRGGTDFSNFTITVFNINDPPEWLGLSSYEIDVRAGTQAVFPFIGNVTDIDNSTEDLRFFSSSPSVTFGPEGLIILYDNKTAELQEDVTITISDGEYSARFVLNIDLKPSWKVTSEYLGWDEGGALNISVSGVPGMDLFIFLSELGYLRMEEKEDGDYTLIVPEKHIEGGRNYSYFFTDREGGPDLTYGAHNGFILSPKGSTSDEGGGFLGISILIVVLLLIFTAVVVFLVLKSKGIIMKEGQEEKEELFGVGVERGEVKGGPLSRTRTL